MMTYAIEKGVSLSPSGAGRPPKYPFKELDVGDSFAFGVEEYDTVRQAAYAFAARHGKRLTVRREGDTCRVWRLS